MELARILARQKELEENNERFMKNEHEIKKEIRSIDILSWTNEEYEFMSRRDEDLLTIREFAAVKSILFSISVNKNFFIKKIKISKKLKLHNTVRPLKIKLEEALKQCHSIEEQFQLNKNELQKLKQVIYLLEFK